MKQKRGRKPIPEQDKKKPVIIYFSENEIEKLGGSIQLKKTLQNYSQIKLKQNEKRQAI